MGQLILSCGAIHPILACGANNTMPFIYCDLLFIRDVITGDDKRNTNANILHQCQKNYNKYARLMIYDLENLR